MIEVGYLVDSKGAQKFGTCASCGKGSDDDPKMVRVTYSHHDSISRTSNCLCADCRRLLLKTIRDGIKDEPTIELAAERETNCSEIPNGSDDTISRQAAIDALDCISGVEEVLRSLPPAQSEPLTDKEQRIFLAAMGREEKVCKQVDDEYRSCREPYEDSLVRTCREIIRKVKGTLWT